jgi:hypothetical protein
MNEGLTLIIPLKIEEDTEAATKFLHMLECKPEHKITLTAYDCPIIIKQKLRKKEDSVENGSNYEHLQAREYLMQKHRNSKNSSITTNMTAFKHSCKDLHQENPLPGLKCSCFICSTVFKV